MEQTEVQNRTAKRGMVICVSERNQLSGLEQELMLLVNERLFQKGLLTVEIYEQAKVAIVKRGT